MITLAVVCISISAGAALAFVLLERGHSNALKVRDDRLAEANKRLAVTEAALARRDQELADEDKLTAKMCEDFDAEVKRLEDKLEQVRKDPEVVRLAAEANEATRRAAFLEKKFLEDPTREKELIAIQAECVNLRADRMFWKQVALGEKQLPTWDEDAPRDDPERPCPTCQGATLHRLKCPMATQGAVGTQAPLDS